MRDSLLSGVLMSCLALMEGAGEQGEAEAGFQAQTRAVVSSWDVLK